MRYLWILLLCSFCVGQEIQICQKEVDCDDTIQFPDDDNIYHYKDYFPECKNPDFNQKLVVLTGNCDLPDAPSAVKSKWLQKLVGKYPKAAPPPLVYNKVRVWTFRKRWTDPPLRNPFKSSVFWVSQSIMLGSMVVAGVRSKYTHEDLHSELPFTMGVFGMNYLTDKYLCELYTIGTSTIVSQHYIRANINGPIK